MSTLVVMGVDTKADTHQKSDLSAQTKDRESWHQQECRVDLYSNIYISYHVGSLFFTDLIAPPMMGPATLKLNHHPKNRP